MENKRPWWRSATFRIQATTRNGILIRNKRFGEYTEAVIEKTSSLGYQIRFDGELWREKTFRRKREAMAWLRPRLVKGRAARVPRRTPNREQLGTNPS